MLRFGREQRACNRASSEMGTAVAALWLVPISANADEVPDHLKQGKPHTGTELDISRVEVPQFDGLMLSSPK